MLIQILPIKNTLFEILLPGILIRDYKIFSITEILLPDIFIHAYKIFSITEIQHRINFWAEKINKEI